MLRTDTPQTIRLIDYQTPRFLVKDVDLTFQIFEDKTVVTALLSFAKNHEGNEPLVLDGEHMVLKAVELDGNALGADDYEVDDHSLTIPCPVAETFQLKTVVEIDPASNTALEGLYKSGGNYCTQCEAEGFRRITYYLDRPDVMAPFKVRIEADKARYPVLLSNGNPDGDGDLGDGRHYACWNDPFPKPCYLFALVVGDLVYIEDVFTTMNGRDVTLRIYVRPGDETQCDHAMESLKKSMKWDEDVYGREYHLSLFNIVAVSDFNMGAMENTSLNIFNTALVLAHPETATDRDFERVEAVIAHEYFHNWTGNLVTCREWFQLSLKEGLTVFRDQEFSSDMNSRGVKRIDDVLKLRQFQFAEDASPMAHPIRPDNYQEINNFYTMTVYEKGAEVIRMQHTLLGAESFRKGTDLYFERHEGQAVTCEDFLQAMQDASGVNLDQFKLWYSQAGTPEVNATTSYDEDKQEYTIELSQHIPDTPGQTNKKPMHIPVAVGLLNPNGHDIDLGRGETTKILHLREAKQSFTFKDIPSRPVPSILRGFSAPVKLTTDLTNEDLCFLMVHDSDGFNQWEAGQTYALRMLNDMTDAVEAGNEPVIWPDFVDSYQVLLQNGFQRGTDKALLAQALTLPDIGLIGMGRNPVDPAAIYTAHKAAMEALSKRFEGEWRKLYDGNRTDPDFKNDFPARAQRSLQNTALAFLCHHPDQPGYDLAKAQYDSANNMTDRVAAVSALTDSDTDARDLVLADFYDRFKDYLLVIDKWFSLQAAAVRPTTLEDVKALKAHPDFTMKNPNRVRSLYSAFAMLNPVCFHDASGKGYDFLHDGIKELNTINPQIAARLLNPLRDWRRYTPDRQDKMKAVLEDIAALDNLSPNVYEIVTKTLKG